MKASVRGFLGELWDITLKLNWGSMKSSLQIASECVAFPRKLKSEVNTIHKTEILPQRSAAETSEVASSWDHTWDFHMMITLDMGLCICSCFSQSHFLLCQFYFGRLQKVRWAESLTCNFLKILSTFTWPEWKFQLWNLEQGRSFPNAYWCKSQFSCSPQPCSHSWICSEAYVESRDRDRHVWDAHATASGR